MNVALSLVSVFTMSVDRQLTTSPTPVGSALGGIFGCLAAFEDNLSSERAPSLTHFELPGSDTRFGQKRWSAF